MLESRHVLAQEIGEPLDLAMLVDDLPRAILDVVVAAEVGLGGVEGDIAAFGVAVRHRVDQQAGNDQVRQVAVGDGLVLLGNDELPAGLQLLCLLKSLLRLRGTWSGSRTTGETPSSRTGSGRSIRRCPLRTERLPRRQDRRHRCSR